MRIISATRRASLHPTSEKTISRLDTPTASPSAPLTLSLAPDSSPSLIAMATLARHLILCSSSPSQRRRRPPPLDATGGGTDRQAPSAPPQSTTRRLAVAASTALAATAALSARRPAPPPPAMAAEAAAVPAPTPGGTVPRWGTRSYVRERYFEPELTAEEAAARIRQTAEGMRTLRPMLETMSWKYVLFYVRLKSKYLGLDLTTAMAGVPAGRRADYVRVANELVDNMTEFDRFVRTPKVYESYLFYEKTLKSLDDVAEFLV